MGHVDEVVDLAVLADAGVLPGPAIDTAVGAEGDAVLQDDAAELGDVDRPLGRSRRAEARLADDAAGVQADAVAHQGETDDHARADITVAADGDARTDDRAGADARAAPNLSAGADDDAGAELNVLFKGGVGMDGGRSGGVATRRVQGGGGLGPGGLRIVGDQGDAAGRDVGGMARGDEAGAGAGRGQAGQMLAAGQEADPVGSGAAQGRGHGDFDGSLGGVAQRGAGELRQRLEAQGPLGLEESRIRHGAPLRAPGPRHASRDFKSRPRRNHQGRE